MPILTTQYVTGLEHVCLEQVEAQAARGGLPHLANGFVWIERIAAAIAQGSRCKHVVHLEKWRAACRPAQIRCVENDHSAGALRRRTRAHGRHRGSQRLRIAGVTDAAQYVEAQALAVGRAPAHAAPRVTDAAMAVLQDGGFFEKVHTHAVSSLHQGIGQVYFSRVKN